MTVTVDIHTYDSTLWPSHRNLQVRNPRFGPEKRKGRVIKGDCSSQDELEKKGEEYYTMLTAITVRRIRGHNSGRKKGIEKKELAIPDWEEAESKFGQSEGKRKQFMCSNVLEMLQSFFENKLTKKLKLLLWERKKSNKNDQK